MNDLSPKVLVVDDESAVRNLMADVLRMKGYRPRTAGNGVEALDGCLRGEGAPDLLVTDVVMPPYFNGIELVRRLRVLKPDMKALYVSAYPADHEVSQAFGDPLSDFLPKPLSPIVLAQTVERMLEGTPGSAERNMRRRQGTVLLMISDAARRHHVKECLAASGVWVLEAMHPTEAQFIGRWNEGPIHLLLMDVPQVAGKGAWLRRLQNSRPEMRTIFVEESEDRFRFTPEGFDGEATDLWMGLRKLLERRDQPQPVV
jgi:CheY-like chemotaxis protein